MSSAPPPVLTTQRQTGQYSPSALELHARPRAERLGAFASAVGFGVHYDVDSGVDSGADSDGESEVESGDAGYWGCCCEKRLMWRAGGLGRDEIVHEPRSKPSVK